MSTIDVDTLVDRMYEDMQAAESKLTFEKAQNEFKEAEEIAKAANLKVKELKHFRDALCPHAIMKPKEFYSSGTYYDAAYTEYWHECACCGHTTPRRDTRHAWDGK